MNKMLMILAVLLVSKMVFGAQRVNKTYDGQLVRCQTEADVKELAREKSVRVSIISPDTFNVELLKCTLDGWVQDFNPQIERVDEPLIVKFPIYQAFHQYTLYVVRDSKVIQAVVLKDLLATGKQRVSIPDWQPQSEILINTLTSKYTEDGKVVDEKHEEYFGSFNVLNISQK